MNKDCLDIVASLHQLQGRRPVKEILEVQSNVLEQGCTEHSLTYERVRMTLHSMIISDEKVTIGSLIQKARSNPAQAWLDSNAANGIEAAEDIYFDRPVYNPRGYVPPADKDDRRRLDATYSRQAIRPRDDAPVKPELQNAIDRIRKRTNEASSNGW